MVIDLKSLLPDLALSSDVMSHPDFDPISRCTQTDWVGKPTVSCH